MTGAFALEAPHVAPYARMFASAEAGSVDKSYMLDTNVFNDILDGRARVEDILPPGARWVVTHVQRDELEATKDEARRQKLLAVLSEVAPEKQQTASLVWDVSRWGEACWPAVPGRFERMLAALDAENGGGRGNARDILIAETAIHLGCVLVSADETLRSVFESFGGQAVSVRRPT
jgi:predicted nucleic acid-binding protein